MSTWYGVSQCMSMARGALDGSGGAGAGTALAEGEERALLVALTAAVASVAARAGCVSVDASGGGLS